MKQAVNNAERVAIDRVKEIADIQAVDLFSLPKISTGITGIDKVLSGGIYLGQTVILTGKRGDGKSTLGSQILANALDNGKSVFAYSGELPDYFFKRWLDFQIAGQQNVIDRAGEAGSVNYFIPDSKVHKISEWYRGRAYLFDSHSTEDNELEHLLSTIEKAIQQYGIQLVLLDNLMTALDIGLDIDLYRAQSKFVDKLVKISKNYNVAVILVVHPRKNSLGAVDSHFSGQYNTMTNKWKWAGERIAQIISEMIRNTERSLEGLAREMKSIGTRMGNNLANGISNATSGITRTLNNVVGKVNSTIGNINSSLSGIERAFSFSYDVTGPTGNRRWGYYNMSLPRVNTIPYLAKGAVIPPRSEFLAVLGDQKQGNNIETPEALLRKIVREESGGQQSSGNYRFTAQINRRTVFDEIIEEAKLRRDTSGRNPFELA